MINQENKDFFIPYNYVFLLNNNNYYYYKCPVVMKTSKIIADLRKQKNWSQSDLAKKTGISQVMVGKYERGDATPSIEVAKKIADAFEVSLDYLAGEGLNSSFDKKTVKRLEDIQNLDSNTQTILFNIIDTYLRDSKTRQAYS